MTALSITYHRLQESAKEKHLEMLRLGLDKHVRNTVQQLNTIIDGIENEKTGIVEHIKTKLDHRSGEDELTAPLAAVEKGSPETQALWQAYRSELAQITLAAFWTILLK